MTPEEVHFIRKTMVMCTSLLGAVILAAGAGIVLSLPGGDPFIALVMALGAVGYCALARSQQSDGISRRIIERLVGEPDTPYWNDLKEEVSLDV